MSESRSLLGRVCSTDLNLRATLHGHFIIKNAGSHLYSSYHGADSVTINLRNNHKLAVDWPFILFGRLVLPGSCEHLAASVYSRATLHSTLSSASIQNSSPSHQPTCNPEVRLQPPHHQHIPPKPPNNGQYPRWLPFTAETPWPPRVIAPRSSQKAPQRMRSRALPLMQPGIWSRCFSRNLYSTSARSSLATPWRM